MDDRHQRWHDQMMKPTELHTLFSAKEQTLLVAVVEFVLGEPREPC